MLMKAIEIRDHATFIPAVAIRMTPLPCAGEVFKVQNYLLARAGFTDGRGIVLMRLTDQKAHADPHDWNDRTHQVVHSWLIEHFDDIVDGAVVDVAFVLGETDRPKRSEKETCPL